MICETLWFIATGITINWGQIVGGRLALVVAIHEFDRESDSGALWLWCTDEG